MNIIILKKFWVSSFQLRVIPRIFLNRQCGSSRLIFAAPKLSLSKVFHASRLERSMWNTMWWTPLNINSCFEAAILLLQLFCFEEERAIKVDSRKMGIYNTIFGWQSNILHPFLQQHITASSSIQEVHVKEITWENFFITTTWWTPPRKGTQKLLMPACSTALQGQVELRDPLNLVISRGSLFFPTLGGRHVGLGLCLKYSWNKQVCFKWHK